MFQKYNAVCRYCDGGQVPLVNMPLTTTLMDKWTDRWSTEVVAYEETRCTLQERRIAECRETMRWTQMGIRTAVGCSWEDDAINGKISSI
jgi:hypothetical protein